MQGLHLWQPSTLVCFLPRSSITSLQPCRRCNMSSSACVVDHRFSARYWWSSNRFSTLPNKRFQHFSQRHINQSYIRFNRQQRLNVLHRDDIYLFPSRCNACCHRCIKNRTSVHQPKYKSPVKTRFQVHLGLVPFKRLSCSACYHRLPIQ